MTLDWFLSIGMASGFGGGHSCCLVRELLVLNLYHSRACFMFCLGASAGGTGLADVQPKPDKMVGPAPTQGRGHARGGSSGRLCSYGLMAPALFSVEFGGMLASDLLEMASVSGAFPQPSVRFLVRQDYVTRGNIFLPCAIFWCYTLV